MKIDRSSYWTHPGVSQSKIKDALPPKTLAHFHALHVLGLGPKRDTKALRRGRALHALLLEPETFEARFPIFVGDIKKDERKAALEALDAEAEKYDGCAIRDISGNGSALSELHGMRDAVLADPRARMLLRSVVEVEVPIAWDCPVTGVECKARLDALTPKFVLDLKTCEDASRAGIEKAIASYFYDVQGAHYLAAAEALTGSRPEAFVLIFVESSPPFAVNVCVISAAIIAEADEARLATLDAIATCRHSGVWPGHEKEFWTVETLPPWAAKRRTSR